MAVARTTLGGGAFMEGARSKDGLVEQPAKRTDEPCSPGGNQPPLSPWNGAKRAPEGPRKAERKMRYGCRSRSKADPLRETRMLPLQGVEAAGVLQPSPLAGSLQGMPQRGKGQAVSRRSAEDRQGAASTSAPRKLCPQPQARTRARPQETSARQRRPRALCEAARNGPDALPNGSRTQRPRPRQDEVPTCGHGPRNDA